MKTKLTREFYVPKDYVEFKPQIGDYPKDLFACYVSKEHPFAIFFVGKQSKPTWHLRFKDNFAMKEKVITTIKRLMTWHEKKLERREEGKSATTLKVGDVLYTSWGYDQTNIDWYQVTKNISPRMIEIRQIYGERKQGEYYDTGTTTPKKDFFIPREEPMRKKVNSGNTVKIESYTRAWAWDGRPKHYSCYA